MNRYFTIGVAGHAGHGKTALVQSLTGMKSDKVREGKEKNQSSQCLIAPLQFASGVQAAFVDVPANPSYLKNMVRGLYPVDMAIIAVAADEGVMHQTREHLQIVQCLGIHAGVVVLTKTDLADEEICSLAEMEINDLTENTFFADAPVCRFSTARPDKWGHLLETIESGAKKVPPRQADLPFRLWIDQVKQSAGFGTIVTGTILQGSIRVNETVKIEPEGRQSRVRFMETHGIRTGSAAAGQRVGINLHKIAFQSVKKGMVLTSPETGSVCRFINAETGLWENAGRPVNSRIRMRLFIGTAVVSAMLVFMDTDFLEPGRKCLVQFRLNRPVSCMPGDRFAVSFLNDNRLVGGGRVLAPSDEKFRKAKASSQIACLKALQENDSSGYLGAVLDRYPNTPFSPADLADRSLFPESVFEDEIRRGLGKDKLIRVGDGVVKRQQYEKLLREVRALFKKPSVGQKSIQPRFHIREVADRLGILAESEVLHHVMARLCAQGHLCLFKGYYQVPAHSVRLSADYKNLASSVMEFANECGLKPFTAGHFNKTHHDQYEKARVEKILRFLVSQNKLIPLEGGKFITPDAVRQIRERMVSFIKEQGKFSIRDCHDVFGYGRSQAVAVLEYLDETGMTKRLENFRVLGPDAGLPEFQQQK
ncbi:MAG: SelB C-terminal domain-containing protein [Desulfosalsimonas sp.]|uniref:SelB domain-containing protein n=1 Tax=Desulfosalsimonas sp. TaxID=3073848 RepID=UPI003970AF33